MTVRLNLSGHPNPGCFQFLGIPPKGELEEVLARGWAGNIKFPISRDPPEGGTAVWTDGCLQEIYGFQFLGIPPKGERGSGGDSGDDADLAVSNF